MDFEFDKEIDLLLRQSAQGKSAHAQQKSVVQNLSTPHLDADELVAFAENALPEKAKQNYLLHLADCDNCRGNLSGLIALNSEQVDEIAQSEEKQFVAAPIPWYRKLFAVPNLVYSLGALVLLFSGIAVYTVLQTARNQQNSEVSQTYEKQPNGKGMSSDGDSVPTDIYAANTMMSNAASMNTSANAPTAPVSNSAVSATPAPSTNSNSVIIRTETDKTLKAESKPAPVTEPRVLQELESVPATPPPPTVANENEFQTDGAEISSQKSAQGAVSPQQNSSLPSSNDLSTLQPALRANPKSKKLESLKDDKRKSSETVSVGGKTFERESNVWYDSTYRGQATTNVTRGTNEYKKLDSGLRSIAERVGGTIVIVWKEKTYRIQ